MFNDYNYNEHLLISYGKECDIFRKKIIWNKWYIVLCIVNFFIWIANSVKYYNENLLYLIYYIFIAIIWLVGAYITTRTIKKDRVHFKNSKIKYDEKLKEIDYPRYIKTQRKDKLKKLKSIWRTK